MIIKYQRVNLAFTQNLHYGTIIGARVSEPRGGSGDNQVSTCEFSIYTESTLWHYYWGEGERTPTLLISMEMVYVRSSVRPCVHGRPPDCACAKPHNN